jgi:hypothetical protein
VEVVGTAFGDDVDDASGDLSELGEIVVGLDLELLDVIDDGLVIVVADEGAEVADAVEEEHVAAVSCAIDGGEGKGADGLASESTAAAGVLRYAHGTDAGSEFEELGEIASVEGEIVDGMGADNGAEFGGAGLDCGGIGGDGDLLVDGTGGEGEVEASGLIDAEHETGEFGGAEAFLGYRDGVVAGEDVDDGKGSSGGGDRGLLYVGVGVLEDDLRAGDNSAGGVGNRTADGGRGLSEHGKGGHKEETEKKCGQQKGQPQPGAFSFPGGCGANIAGALRQAIVACSTVNTFQDLPHHCSSPIKFIIYQNF